MRASLPVLLAVIVLAGCRPETARPVPVDDRPRHPTISSGGGKAPPPPADAAVDGEPMSPEKARETAREPEVESTGILEVLKDDVVRKKTPNVLSPGGNFSEEEMKAIDEALGTLEKKTPPPLEQP